MSTENNVTLMDIDDSGELASHFDNIAELFLECFEKPLDKELWDWAYANNPHGHPLVSLAISNNKVVGHYAVIPITLSNSMGTLSGYLSMTTMVSSSFRKHRLFQTLAERVFERIESREVPSVVFGFPNNNSVPGFKKRLGWTIDENYKVVTLTQPLQKFWSQSIENESFGDKYTLSLTDEIRDWRTSKPQQSWSLKNGVGLKRVGEKYDLMYVDNPKFISEVDVKDKTYAILPIPQGDEVELNCEIAFPYRFGYRLFNFETDQSPEFFVQMCMSDVF